MIVYWPGRKKTRLDLGPWLGVTILVNLAVVLGFLVLWSVALTAWVVYGYALGIKYLCVAGAAMIGTMFGFAARAAR